MPRNFLNDILPKKDRATNLEGFAILSGNGVFQFPEPISMVGCEMLV
jgi:hypothetical protein